MVIEVGRRAGSTNQTGRRMGALTGRAFIARSPSLSDQGISPGEGPFKDSRGCSKSPLKFLLCAEPNTHERRVSKYVPWNRQYADREQRLAQRPRLAASPKPRESGSPT